MRFMGTGWAGFLVVLLAALLPSGKSPPAAQDRITHFPLSSANSAQHFELVNAEKAEVVTYRGRQATTLIPSPGHEKESALAILPGTDFKDGTIEVEIAGFPRPTAAPDDRGFIGIAFRVQEHGSRYECFYIRPTNGRADDQLRRNHSLQYVSEPEYPWERLRKENPGVYESYADLELGAWTNIKIVVSGVKAQMFVNGASQPSLIVNDLKLGETSGAIALWSYNTTDAHFSNVKITRK